MAPPRPSRRRLFAGALASALAASCQRKARCGHCGMALDPASRWYAELAFADGSARGFDTPRCAFSAWRGPSREARELYARGHYQGARLPSGSLRFASGSDVLGPMGPDLVPVEPEHADAFARDHHARAMLRASEVSPAVLNELS
ncbi:MAG TPA: nitrous oxide reductase accessory protein NosL [Polyangiaceae bacterium]|nr:nitrous oxide reductase accessory protein NosL [Polyangiaceae bacterium]